jgi:hypothetical protein
MRRSDERILTTHIGGLPRPPELARRHCQLSGLRAPFCCPAPLEGNAIRGQRTFRPEPLRHRHNEHTTTG